MGTKQADKGRKDASLAPEATREPKSQLGRMLADGLDEIIADLDAKGGEKRLTVRTSRIDMTPGEYPPDRVKATRDSLNLSQGVFAAFLGVNIGTVQSWEQGKRPPSDMARRFMDEIHADLKHARKRIRALVGTA